MCYTDAPFRSKCVILFNNDIIHLAFDQQEDVEEGAASALDTSVQDMSISFGEMDLDRKDISFVPFSDTTSSSPSSGSVSSSGSTNGWAGRKWIVDEAKLMELFRTCSQCGVAIEDKRVATRASQIIIHWTCLKGHTGEWASCTDQRKMGRNNLLSCAATFFTGATYSDIKEWAKLINLQLPSKSQFYAIQSKYLIPVTNHAYKGQQQKILERIFQLSAAGQKLEMCGDARCDSPGKHCYSSDFGLLSNIHNIFFYKIRHVCFSKRLQLQVQHLFFSRWCNKRDSSFWTSTGKQAQIPVVIMWNICTVAFKTMSWDYVHALWNNKLVFLLCY